MLYEVIVKGHLSKTTAGCLRPVNIELMDSGHTKLMGSIPDQAALFGLLTKIRDLNIELVSLKQLDSNKNF